MSDLDAVRAVLARYAMAIDLRDFDKVAGCFTPGAHAEYGGVALEGAAAIVTHLRRVEAFLVTTHILGQPWLEPRGDKVHARTPALACLVDRDGQGERLRMRGLSYTDTLELWDGQWRIAHRRHEVRWSSTAPARLAGALEVVQAGEPDSSSTG